MQIEKIAQSDKHMALEYVFIEFRVTDVAFTRREGECYQSTAEPKRAWA